MRVSVVSSFDRRPRALEDVVHGFHAFASSRRDSGMGSLLSFLTAAYYMPRLYFSPNSVKVALRRTFAAKEEQQITLHELVKARCPSLFREYRPAWWLASGHLQTLYCVVGDFSNVDKVEYDRTLLRTLDGGTIGLDFTPPQDQRMLPEETPIVVVLHGLTGGSHESYVRAILAPACTPIENGGLGYRGVVVNFRGCAGVPITSPQLYSAGHTDDIRVALMYLSKRYPKAPLLGLGFSLGANVLTRYLAEEGEYSRIVAGCVLACPWDLLANGESLETHWLQSRTYSRGMARNLIVLMKRHLSSLAKFPESDLYKAIHKITSMSHPTLMQFDDTVTRVGGGSSPPFPFPSARDYYRWASSHNLLPHVRVPLLALNSADDPIVRTLPIDKGEDALGPSVVFGVTNGGGHLGWFEYGATRFSLNRWMKKPVLEWLKAMGEDIAIDVRTKDLREVDGFLKEEGRNDIGCKEVGGGGHVIGIEGEEGLLAGL
ncbi:AB-hydrolase YheT [Panus rudis PR-1116 ss-1]|nr:AB-hydrolase YheT [Panus rudis PR-1116 ss-1]